jgi:hypothetical protein
VNADPRSPAVKVLVYSDDVNTRQQVILALGRVRTPTSRS